VRRRSGVCSHAERQREALVYSRAAETHYHSAVAVRFQYVATADKRNQVAEHPIRGQDERRGLGHDLSDYANTSSLRPRARR